MTATVVGTIALGLGLSAAVFTIFNALVFRPEAVRDPDSLFSYSWSTRAREWHRFYLAGIPILTMRALGALRTYPLQLAFWVVVALGTLALVLTLSGIYGVLSYLVVLRTKEIGVRIALGATSGTVTRLMLWQSLRLVALGLAAGACLAWGVSTILTSMLPVAGPFAGTIDLFDGVAYGGSLLSVLAACVLAASVPALRAARIDPIATLRHD